MAEFAEYLIHKLLKTSKNNNKKQHLIKTVSTLVTRGNVAIYCYNALTAKTWDVAESTDGQLTSKKSSDTILAKYFSDFVNEEGQMKLVEEATVELCGATSNKIGANQIELSATGLVDAEGDDTTFVKFIEAEKAPKKGEENVTYAKGSNVVAYVPTEVANVASLAGKTVNVIFGRDNEVAYIEVTEDSVESAYVTAFDADKRTMKIDGVSYDLADIVKVSVFGHDIADDNIEYTPEGGSLVTASASIADLFSDLSLGATKRTMSRNIFVDYTLNSDDEISKINFEFAAAYNENSIVVKEYVVEKRNGDKLTTVGSETRVNLETYADDFDPRVVKDGEIAELADIEAGDVVTEVSYNSKVEVLYVSSNTVEGEIEDYDTVTVVLDGTDYVVSLRTSKVFANEDGEIDDYSEKTLEQAYLAFENESVTAYLNMAGEIVAVVGESDATGTVVGLVTYAAREKDKAAKVWYLDVEILAEDGTKEDYAIYNEDEDEDMAEGSDATYAGKVVVFSADVDGIIKSDEITVVKGLEGTDTATDCIYDLSSNDDVKAIKVPAANIAKLTMNKTNKTITVAADANIHSDAEATYYYKSSTVLMDAKEKEVMNKWTSIVDPSTDTAFAPVTTGSDIYLFVKGTKLLYVVASVETRGTTEELYGIVASKTYPGSDDDYFVKVLVDGEVQEFECASGDRAALNAMFDKNSELGGLISFKLSDGKISDMNEKLTLDYIDYLEDIDDETSVFVSTTGSDDATTLGAFATVTTTKFASLEVTDVYADEDNTSVELNDSEVVELAEDYIAYRLTTNEVVDGVEDGDFIIYFDNDEGYNVVIILN